jgi:cell division protein FtsB
MKEETKIQFANWFAGALVVLVLGFGVAKLAPKYRQFVSLRGQVAEREAKIAECRRKTAEINEMQRRFETDSEFVESIARQNHRVYPGEIVFVFDGKERR